MIALDAGAAVAYGPLLAAIPIAMVAGFISFVSPCCLPLLPGYLAYVSGTAGADAASQSGRRRVSTVVVGTVLFVLGFAVVFTSYGAAFGALGAGLVRHQVTLTRVLGIVTIVMGLLFAGALAWLPGSGQTFRLRVQPRSDWPGRRCWA